MSLQNRLVNLENKTSKHPESDTPVKIEYARDRVPAATIIEAVILAIELGIPINDITRGEG